MFMVHGTPQPHRKHRKSLEVFLRTVVGIAKSVNPDQTAPKGAVCFGSTLIAFETTKYLPYIKFKVFEMAKNLHKPQ